jgi:hypothetical protein
MVTTAPVDPPRLARLGERVHLAVREPAARSSGGVLGACRHHTREVFGLGRWAAHAAATAVPGLVLSSAWLNEYEVGDFVALHTDRPDCALTGLIAIDVSSEPLTLCRDLAPLSPAELIRTARNHPFPGGEDVLLSSDAIALFDGASVPHHRAPTKHPCSVLTLTFVAPVARDRG